MQHKQARRLILAALERVPLRRRAVLVMHDLDEIPVSEVASTLKVRPFTIYSRLRKARLELAAALRRMLKAAERYESPGLAQYLPDPPSEVDPSLCLED